MTNSRPNADNEILHVPILVMSDARYPFKRCFSLCLEDPIHERLAQLYFHVSNVNFCRQSPRFTAIAQN